MSTKTTEYGINVTKTVNIGTKGSISVIFHYKGGDMAITPIIASIIPKIFK